MFKKFKNRRVKILIIILGIIAVGAVTFIIVRASSTYVSDTFTDETKIGKGTEKVYVDTSAGQVKLPECYTASTSWAKVKDTLVRNIAGAYDATVAKDIYCDDNNCILYTDGEIPPAVVCVATNSNVYANLLWSKTDSTSDDWGPSEGITGNDIGGTHGNINVGNDPDNVNAKNWLERYYASDASTYDAMDRCKAKGSGWRLPNILELDSIRDQAKGAAPYTYLPGIVSSSYWSSTETSSTSAYYPNFDTGSVRSNDKTNSYYVRCVKGQ